MTNVNDNNQFVETLVTNERPDRINYLPAGNTNASVLNLTEKTFMGDVKNSFIFRRLKIGNRIAVGENDQEVSVVLC